MDELIKNLNEGLRRRPSPRPVSREQRRAAQRGAETDARKLSRGNARYAEAQRKHAERIDLAQRHFTDQLHNPVVVERLGLPAGLPEESIDILKATMALDKYGPSQPKLSDYVR